MIPNSMTSRPQLIKLLAISLYLDDQGLIQLKAKYVSKI